MPVEVQLLVPDVLTRGSSIAQDLMNALRANSPAIERLIEARIRARTPEMRGALKEAITGQAYTGGVSGNQAVMLAKWYADDGPQLEVWNRVYVMYQEGEPLGTHTYTNGPRQMFKQVEVSDLGLIQDWAETVVGGASETLFGGAGGASGAGSSVLDVAS